MNRIIALRGTGSTGKSTSIKYLRDLLLANGFLELSTTFRRDRNDFVSVFQKGKKKIGVASAGDTYEIVRNNLQEFISQGCEICVCACRSFDRFGQGTNAAIAEFTTYTAEFIENVNDPNSRTQDNKNKTNAQVLFDRINHYV